MIAALARGAQILNEPDYAYAAQRAMQFIFNHLRREDNRLLHRYRDGETTILANVDDYAFVIRTCSNCMKPPLTRTISPRLLRSILT